MGIEQGREMARRQGKPPERPDDPNDDEAVRAGGLRLGAAMYRAERGAAELRRRRQELEAAQKAGDATGSTT